MNNYKVIFLLALTNIFIITKALAQVGIGTTNPHPSSVLDIQSSSKGVLLPHVALTSSLDSHTIANPKTGLLVFNTNETNGLTRGFYFWNNSKWSEVGKTDLGSGSGGSNASSWNLAGNNLDSYSGSHFIGTTSYDALNFKVDNNSIGYLHPNGGVSFGIGSSVNENRSIALGQNANANNAVEAQAIGPYSKASGYRSMAFGYKATSTANGAMSLGDDSKASGYRSMAIGYGAKSNNNDAVALGVNSSAVNESSVAIGTNANASGQNSVAIGKGSVANNANTIILGNTTPDSQWAGTKIGLGTSNPSTRLEVVGSVKIVDGTQGAGKVLTSDANGKASWTNLSSNVVYAEMYKSSSSSNQQMASYNPVVFGSSDFSSGVTVRNNNFQVLTSGVYRVTYNVSIERLRGGGNQNLGFVLGTGWNNSDKIQGSASYNKIKSGEKRSFSMTKIVHLNAYQELYLFPTETDSNTVILPNSAVMSIELIKAD
ncbi:hypothetical protein [Corallibacter sp.]|uniref:hypothetical protein n=1 Tax=Corallibacter sp. TaxID=2038084 RepID=UPI003AB4A4B4